jgi:hypothetical protein
MRPFFVRHLSLTMGIVFYSVLAADGAITIGGRLLTTHAENIADAEVLLNPSGISVYSGKDGTFTIIDSAINIPVNISPNHCNQNGIADLWFDDRSIYYDILSGVHSVAVRFYNLQGRLIANIPTKKLGAGSYRCPLMNGLGRAMSQQIIITSVTVDNEIHSFKKILLQKRFIASPNDIIRKVSRGVSAAKLLAANSLTILKAGFRDTIVTLPSLPGDIDMGDIICAADPSAPYGRGVYGLDETVKGELLYQIDTMYSEIIADSILGKFYANNSDTFDFLLAAPMNTVLQSNFNFIINRNIAGICSSDNVGVYPALTKNLQSLIQLSFSPGDFEIYKTDVESGKKHRFFTRLALHEMEHLWGVEIKGLYEDTAKVPPAHWTSNMDLFYQDTVMLDPLQNYRWVRKNGRMICVSDQRNNAFSDLSLYLMGFIPPQDVRPFEFHEFQPDTNEWVNVWGPSDADNPTYLYTRIVSIEGIVASNGARFPNSSNSKKTFRCAFIIIKPSGTGEYDPEFIEYVNRYKRALVADWHSASKGLSEILF